MSLPTIRRKVGPELPPIWLKRFASASHSPTMSATGQSASHAPKPPCAAAMSSIAAALSRTALILPPVPDQPRIAEQRIERLVRHRPYPARVEAVENLLEGRPFRIDEAVLEPGAEDAQRHLRQIAVVGNRPQFLRRLRLRQPRLECRRRRAGRAPRRGFRRRTGWSSALMSMQVRSAFPLRAECITLRPRSSRSLPASSRRGGDAEREPPNFCGEFEPASWSTTRPL